LKKNLSKKQCIIIGNPLIPNTKSSSAPVIPIHFTSNDLFCSDKRFYSSEEEFAQGRTSDPNLSE